MKNELMINDKRRLVETMEENEALIEIRTNPEIFPHFNTFTHDEKKVRLQAIMLKCYQMRHIKDISLIGMDSEDLVNMIDKDKKYRDMSFEEMRTAMTNGAADKYGECRGLTVAFFLKCLKSYIDDNIQNYMESVRQKEKAERKAYEDMMRKNTIMKLEESKRRAAIERAAKELVYNSKSEQA